MCGPLFCGIYKEGDPGQSESVRFQFTRTCRKQKLTSWIVSYGGSVLCSVAQPCPTLWEKAMAPHSSTFAWKIPWMEEPGGLQSMGSLESDTTERLHFHFSPACIGEGNGNPLQCSCLENPRDGGAWWAVVYGVTQSRTRLKWLSSSSMPHCLAN